jgi:hypothetical protein
VEISSNIFDRTMEFKLKDGIESEVDMIHLQGALGASLQSGLALSDSGMTAIGVPKITLKQYASLQLDVAGTSPSCIVAQRSDLLLATYDGRLIAIPWKNPHLSKIKEWYLHDIMQNLVRIQKTEYTDAEYVAKDGHAIYICKMVYDKFMNVMAWVLSDGSAYLIQRKQDPWMVLEAMSNSDSTSLSDDISYAEWRLQLVNPRDENSEKPRCFTCIALNSEFRMLAVGDESGDIYVYRIDETGSKNICFSHCLLCNRINETMPTDSSFSGKVTNLEWMTEGSALATSYEHGLIIWSVFGYPLVGNFEDPIELK